MRGFILISFFLYIAQTVHTQATNIDYKLFELPSAIFKPIDVPQGFRAAYELRIKQLIDHTDSSKGYFYQRAFLSHKGFNKPTVLVTEGYQQHRNRLSELTQLLDANQIIVEHRYFGQSVPEEMDYSYLNLKQATTDLHNITTIFKEIYISKWISTGISKGGQTTIFYKYYYPDDMDANVPYVAPFCLSYEDKRIYTFLDTIGDASCREKIKNVQFKILENREEALTYLKWYKYGAALDYTYHTFEEAFEYMVLEYPFSFWQWGYKCEDIPDTTRTLEQLLVYLLNISEIDFYSDRDVERYASHYYQAATEMGYYGYETDAFNDLLVALPVSPRPHAAFLPNKMEVEFDGTLVKKVYKWLEKHGDRMIYIYGGTDTWTATAIPPNKDRESLWFFMEGIDHGKARIRNMSEQEKELLYRTLESWLGIPVNPIW